MIHKSRAVIAVDKARTVYTVQCIGTVRCVWRKILPPSLRRSNYMLCCSLVASQRARESHRHFTPALIVPAPSETTMVASAVFITDLQGKAIISRNYRGDVPLNKAIEQFAKYLTEVEDEQKKPVFHVDTNGDFAEGDEGVYAASLCVCVWRFKE